MARVGDYFWIVMRVESPNPQRRYSVAARKHPTEHEARVEAKRLAQEHPAATFAVLGVTAVYRGKGRRVRIDPSKGKG